MPNVMRFLEMMGKSADLRYARSAALYRALNEDGIENDAQWAMLREDKNRLEALLGARTGMICALLTPEGNIEERFMQDVRLAANA